MRRSPWALPLTIIVLAAVFLGYWGTARSIVDIWNNYETFTHGYIIVPISLWLIWKQRTVLAQIPPRPSWLGLAGLALIVFIWLLGKLSGTQVVMQYAFAALLPAVVLAVLGWNVVRPIAFPLAFLLLAVPFGDAFIDPLMNQTADFTVAALQMTGIPVFREGNTMTIPTGTWSVVEACSGVRYLIASMTLGAIYAYLTYRSLWRRASFILASIIVPIFANSVRAYMIVMIGHLSGMKYAVGVDHLIYGWLFFGLVMLILFWVGSFWREDEQPLAEAPPPQVADGQAASAARLALVALLAIGVLAAAPWYNARVMRIMARQAPVSLPDVSVAGWARVGPFTDWLPEYKGAAAQRMIFWERNGQAAGVYLGYYRNQTQAAELIRYGNVLAQLEGDGWRRLGESQRALPGMELRVRQDLLGRGPNRLLAWYWYWVGDGYTLSPYEAKAKLALNRLLLRPDDSAVIAVFAPYRERPEEAIPVLRDLTQAILPGLTGQLMTARKR